MSGVHRAIAINTLSLPDGTFGTHVEQVARLGALAISPGIEEVTACDVDTSATRLRDAGLTVATLTHRAFGFATAAKADAARARLDATIDIAARIGARTVTLTTGGRGTLRWPEAAARFAEAMMPCADRARSTGIALLLEPTSHLYADASIAHRLTDTIGLARRSGIGIAIDLFACWTDADIEDAIAAAGPITTLVQISDQIDGDRALPCRAVPGDGMIPLDRLVRSIVGAGFDGFWDIEVIGPRLAAEGHERGLARAAARIGAWIDSARPLCAVEATDQSITVSKDEKAIQRGDDDDAGLA